MKETNINIPARFYLLIHDITHHLLPSLFATFFQFASLLSSLSMVCHQYSFLSDSILLSMTSRIVLSHFCSPHTVHLHFSSLLPHWPLIHIHIHYKRYHYNVLRVQSLAFAIGDSDCIITMSPCGINAFHWTYIFLQRFITQSVPRLKIYQYLKSYVELITIIRNKCQQEFAKNPWKEKAIRKFHM